MRNAQSKKTETSSTNTLLCTTHVELKPTALEKGFGSGALNISLVRTTGGRPGDLGTICTVRVCSQGPPLLWAPPPPQQGGWEAARLGREPTQPPYDCRKELMELMKSSGLSAWIQWLASGMYWMSAQGNNRWISG